MMAFGTAIVNLNGAILVGLKKPFFGLFADTIFRPLFIVLGITIVLFIGVENDRVGALIWWVALFYLGLATIHFFITVRAIQALPRETAVPQFETRRWWVYALPWIIVALSSDFFFDIDLLLLSTLLDKEQIAIFGVCARMFVLASFGIIAIDAVVSPDLLAAEERQDNAALEAKIGDANLVGTILAIILTIGVMIFSPIVFFFFGPEFNQGVIPLTILCSALVARAAFGRARLFSRHEKALCQLARHLAWSDRFVGCQLFAGAAFWLGWGSERGRHLIHYRRRRDLVHHLAPHGVERVASACPQKISGTQRLDISQRVNTNNRAVGVQNSHIDNNADAQFNPELTVNHAAQPLLKRAFFFLQGFLMLFRRKLFRLGLV